MKKKLLCITLLTSISFALPVQAENGFGGMDSSGSNDQGVCYRGARAPSVVKNLNDVIVSQKPGVTAEKIKEAIIKAGKKMRWTITEASPGELRGNLMVRGKHTIDVSMPYSADRYSLIYKDSTNMNYAACNGKEYIHPNYNVWVQNLNRAIQSELDSLN